MRAVKCPRCKSDNVVSIEEATMVAERNRAHKRCYCLNVPHPHQPTHQLCRQYLHEHIVMHWPKDHSFTVEREAELEEMYRRIWDNNRRTRCY